MTYWLTDTQLFLYAKGTGPDDVHLWRCKKPASSSSSSSLVVPMKPDDFDFVKIVENHLELIGYMDVWDEPDYNRLVKYLYEKRFLVNSQGFVIAELLHKVVDQQDGNKMIDDANQEEVPAIYIRSLDVLPLKPYIPKLSERPIPLRTVKYLGDVNGKAAAMMEEKDSNEITKLTARVADLESKNKTLDTKLTEVQVAMTDKVDDLESKNKTLEDKVTKLTTDLVTQMNELSTRVWMNELTSSEWIDFKWLFNLGTHDEAKFFSYPGNTKVDESWTNVRASYWYKVKLFVDKGWEYKTVCLEDLTPNKELARFSRNCNSFTSKGKTYVCRGDLHKW